MEDKKNIYMILTNGFDPDVRVYKEAKYLVEKGFNVTILCWDRKGDYVEKQNDSIDGVKLKRFHIPSIPGSGMKQLIPFFKYIKAVKKFLKIQKFEYLYCHDFDGMLTGYIATLFKNIKYVFDMHEIYSKKYKFLVKYFIKKSNRIIYVNDEQLYFLNLEKNDKYIYLPNYPEEVNYLPIEKEKQEKTRINYIGFLRDYDSLKTLMNIGENNFNIEIGLYGIGTYHTKLYEENHYENVKLYGKFDGVNEVSKIYRNTDILYCVYNPEIYNWKTAYPIKLYESIITKTPIIVSNDTKAGEFVKKNKIGEVVDFGNIDSLNKAIKNIEKQYKKYTENLEKIRDAYKWEYVVKNLDEIFID